MLSLFRTNQAYAGLLLFVYAFVLWLPLFFGPDPIAVNMPGNGVWGDAATHWFAGHPWLAILASIVLVSVQGIQLNTWATRHRLSRTITQFPGLFLVLISALVYSFHGFSAFHIANIFLLFGCLSIGRIYKQEEPAVALFNAGAWLSIASLFRPEYLLFLPAFIAAISILRKIKLQSILQLLTGVALVYFFLIVISYSTGTLGVNMRVQFGSFGLPALQAAALPDLIGLALLGVLIPGVIFSYQRIAMMLNIEGRKNTQFLNWTLLFGLLVAFGTEEVRVENAQVIVPVLGGLVGLALVNVRPARAEAIHLLLFAAALLPVLLPFVQGVENG